jgi:hypothetical protein
MKQQEVSVASAALHRETDDMLTVDKDKENTPSRTLGGSRSQSFEEVWDSTQSEK